MSNAKLSDPEFLKTYEELTDHYNEDLKVEILDRNLKKLGFLSETELAILKERERCDFVFVPNKNLHLVSYYLRSV